MTNETVESDDSLTTTRIGLATGALIGLTLGSAHSPGGAVGLAIFLGHLGYRFEVWATTD